LAVDTANEIAACLHGRESFTEAGRLGNFHLHLGCSSRGRNDNGLNNRLCGGQDRLRDSAATSRK
jgi:hypothetical protein